MDIGSQNEGKILVPTPGHDGKVYLPSPGHDGKVYVHQSMSAPSTPAWTSTTLSPQPQVSSYVPPQDGSYAGDSYGYAPPAEKSDDRRTICGLRRTTFILSTIIAALLLALALGLGLGLGLGRNGGQNDGQNGTSLGANQPSSTPEATPASPQTTGTRTTLVLTVTQTVSTLPTMLDLDCPSPANPSPTVKLLGPQGNPTSTFAMKCGKDNVGFDIMNTLSYSMEDCMRACAMYNHWTKPGCAGVQFWKDIADSALKWDGNCFLKSGVATTLGDKNPRDTVWLELVEEG